MKIQTSACNRSDQFCQECSVEGTCQKCDNTQSSLVGATCRSEPSFFNISNFFQFLPLTIFLYHICFLRSVCVRFYRHHPFESSLLELLIFLFHIFHHFFILNMISLFVFPACGAFCSACYYNNTPACTNCQQALGPKGNVFNTTDCAGEQGGDDAEDENRY